ERAVRGRARVRRPSRGVPRLRREAPPAVHRPLAPPVSIWDAVVTPRRVVVYSPRPVDEARAIVRALMADDTGGGPRSRTVPGVTIVDGAVDGARVTFTASTRPDAEPGSLAEPPRYAFTGLLEGGEEGSVLAGSITTPMTYGVPAAGL